MDGEADRPFAMACVSSVVAVVARESDGRNFRKRVTKRGTFLGGVLGKSGTVGSRSIQWYVH